MIQLSDEEAGIVAAEAEQAADQVQSPQLRTAYIALAETAADGSVPDDLEPALETLLQIGLESGRIRALYTAHGELAMASVYARTPRGRRLRETTSEVNEALQSLEGDILEALSIRPAGSSGYDLVLTTSRGRLLIQLGKEGARLKSLDVG